MRCEARTWRRFASGTPESFFVVLFEFLDRQGNEIRLSFIGNSKDVIRHSFYGSLRVFLNNQLNSRWSSAPAPLSPCHCTWLRGRTEYDPPATSWFLKWIYSIQLLIFDLSWFLDFSASSISLLTTLSLFGFLKIIYWIKIIKPTRDDSIPPCSNSSCFLKYLIII